MPICICILGGEVVQLFCDAPTTELPLSMLSTGEGKRLTIVDLAVKTGAVGSHCKRHFNLLAVKNIYLKYSTRSCREIG